MATLSEAETEACDRYPIKDGLDGFLREFEPKFKSFSLSDFKAFLHSDEALDVVRRLIGFLASLPATSCLSSRHSSKNLCEDIFMLGYRVSSGLLNVELTALLLERVINHSPDHDIWCAVYDLVTRATTLTEATLLALTPPALALTTPPDFALTLSAIAHVASKNKTKAATRRWSTWARTPHSVQRWDNFLPNANGMAVDDRTPRFERPNFKIRKHARQEADVQEALMNNVLDVLSETIGGRQSSKELFCCPPVLALICGEPDFVLEASCGKLLLPIEVKTKWDLPGDETLLDAEYPPGSNSITQIFGYMANNKRQYGVLSTYENTWFLWRPENDPGALFISDAVKYDDKSPTLLRCFAYIMSLARQDSDCPFPPPSSLQTPKTGGVFRVEKLDRGDLKLEKFDWGSFEVVDRLGYGRCGYAFDGTLRGERVAIKLTDLWQHPELHEEMLTEARVYVELGKLQGRGIPKLIGVGYTAGGLFALMTEFSGAPIEVKNLNDAQREMTVRVLASIHGEGYLHGDIRVENVLVEHRHDGARVTFIDFGFSRKYSRQTEAEREMAVLRKMIGFRSPIRSRTYYQGG